ncbi:hypothetical protein JCM4814A_83010 [Streptomyces phaeofaciens JCM 4814]|uniref:Uncharacterized protein n=1 Tax=Streptomyces phaeofaciens TaxID=68254 RepID=A0A918LZD2_9ACTN|nr:hypothetical protein GCM10010226_71640 [Streptomyces phaeofaciens]
MTVGTVSLPSLAALTAAAAPGLLLKISPVATAEPLSTSSIGRIHARIMVTQAIDESNCFSNRVVHLSTTGLIRPGFHTACDHSKISARLWGPGYTAPLPPDWRSPKCSPHGYLPVSRWLW